jgi:hypothetical protein
MESTIKVLPIRDVPDFARPIVELLGLTTINWGKMEQQLEMLLHAVNRADYSTGRVRFPTTSFRLKVELFKDLYGHHPHFVDVHHVARPISKGLRKANKSRIFVTHSTVQEFLPGPPVSVKVIISRIDGDDFKVAHGHWTIQQLADMNELLCLLCEDLAKISHLTMNEDFRRSLRKELSQTQKALIWVRRLRSRVRRLCSRICDAQD